MNDARTARRERLERRQAPVAALPAPSAEALPQPKAVKPPAPLVREPSREELDPLSRLLYDANSYLSGYVEALKAASASQRDSRNFNRA